MPSCLAEVRDAVARLRQALLAPGGAELERLLPELEAAAEILRSTTPTRQHLPELRALRLELRHAAGLIESGAASLAGWVQAVAAAVGGYTASGQAVALPAAPRRSVRG
jgi:hypothetical protein